MHNKVKKLILLAIFAFLLLMPFFWTTSDLYNLGGDDTRLYTYAPYQVLRSFSLYSWYGESFGQYNPQQQNISFSLLGIILKYLFPFLNLQKMLYGLIFSLGFLAVYLLIREISVARRMDGFSFHSSVIGGLLYVFFPIQFYFWNHPLWGEIVGFAGYPLFLLFFFKAINTKRIRYLVYGSLVGVVFARSTIPYPNFYALLLGVFVFLLVYLLLFKKKSVLVLKYVLFYVAIFLSINAFWIIPWTSGVSTQVARVSGTSATAKAIEYRSYYMSVYHTILGLPSQLVKNTEYARMFAPLSILLVLVFFLASLYRITNSRTLDLKKIWTSLAITTLALAYLLTVNIGNFGIRFFVWLTMNIPSWVMFRSFYRRFSQVYALFYSLTLGISLVIITRGSQKLRTRSSPNDIKEFILALPLKKIIVVGTTFIILLQAAPLFHGDIINQSIYPGGSTTRNVKVPYYYINLLNYISKSEKGRTVSLPFLKGAWSFFKSESGNGLYIGKSPIRFLTGRYEINGLYSLTSFPDQEIGLTVKRAMETNNYLILKHFFGISSVNHILYNAEAFEYLSPQKVGPVESVWGYSEFQTVKSIKKLLTGISAKKIREFGPIHVYEFPKEYHYPLVYITESLTYFEGNGESFLQLPIHGSTSKRAFYLENDRPMLDRAASTSIYMNDAGERYYNGYMPNKANLSLEFQKINPVRYKVNIVNSKRPFFVILSDRYDPGWKVYSGDLNWLRLLVTSSVDADHFTVNGYANCWYIDTAIVDRNGDGNLTLTLYFWPQNLFYIGAIISLIAFAFCMVCLFKDKVKSFHILIRNRIH